MNLNLTPMKKQNVLINVKDKLLTQFLVMLVPKIALKVIPNNVHGNHIMVADVNQGMKYAIQANNHVLIT